MFKWLTKLFKFDPSPKADCLKIIKAVHEALLPISSTANIVGLKLHARFTPSAISVKSPKHWLIRIRLSIDLDPGNLALCIQAAKYDGHTWSYSIGVLGNAMRDTDSFNAHDWELLYKIFVQMGLDTPFITIERPNAIGTEAEALLQCLTSQKTTEMVHADTSADCKEILQCLYTLAKSSYDGREPVNKMVSVRNGLCSMVFDAAEGLPLTIMRLELAGMFSVPTLMVQWSSDGSMLAIYGLKGPGTWQHVPSITAEEWRRVYRALDKLGLTEHRDADGQYAFKFYHGGGTYV